jgi:mono/diheme cytochrome c family protein
MRMRLRLMIAAFAASLSAGAAALAAAKSDEPNDPPEPPSFARDVMPTLGRYCESCHGMRQQHGGLRLDNYDNLMRGGDSGPAVIARDPKGSLLLAKIEHRDRPTMPPRKWLPKAAIARIRAWIVAGAEP